MLESWKQSSAMMMQVGLTGANSGNCRSTRPTLLRIVGSLANHPGCEVENKKMSLQEKSTITREAIISRPLDLHHATRRLNLQMKNSD